MPGHLKISTLFHLSCTNSSSSSSSSSSFSSSVNLPSVQPAAGSLSLSCALCCPLALRRGHNPQEVYAEHDPNTNRRCTEQTLQTTRGRIHTNMGYLRRRGEIILRKGALLWRLHLRTPLSCRHYDVWPENRIMGSCE